MSLAILMRRYQDTLSTLGEKLSERRIFLKNVEDP